MAKTLLPVLCPSSRGKEGAILLGVVQGDGKVAFLPERLEVDGRFVEIAREGRRPEKRFRFSSKCAQGACRQWTGERCGVIDTVLRHTEEERREPGLPACSIRPQCRWFLQNGAEACTVCPLVITDHLVEE